MKKAKGYNPPFELWQTVHIWLKACGNKPSSNFCKEEITTHPNYPSLLSVVDFLDSGDMRYRAVKSDFSHIDDFNYPLLAHIKFHGDERLHIIKEVGEWDQQKEITQNWSGIAIYPEKYTQWHNEKDSINKRNEIKNNFILFALLITGIALFVTSVILIHAVLINAFGLLSLFGLVVSVIALGTELGFQSEIVKQVCGTGGDSGCEKVLKSSYAKGFVGFTPADLSVLYFGSQFITYLYGCWFPVILQNIYFFAFWGIAIAGLSLYAQAVKLKQWCTLCLGIVAVLLLQSTISALIYSGSISLKDILISGVFLLVLIIPLVLIKPILKTNSSNKIKLAELKKWKLDESLFRIQLQQEQQVDTTIWQNDLLLGNPQAPLQITVACNVYCRPCAKAHVQLDNLLRRFSGDLKVQIRFLFTEKNSAGKRIMGALLRKSVVIEKNSDLQAIITDWFDSMNYDKWIEKWNPDSSINIDEKMEQHINWVKQSNISYTPTFFINGKKLPGRYSLRDLELLIPQLIGDNKQYI